jgi:hypothetical protein
MRAGVAPEAGTDELGQALPAAVQGLPHDDQLTVLAVVGRVALPVPVVEGAGEVDEEVTDRGAVDQSLQLGGRVGRGFGGGMDQPARQPSSANVSATQSAMKVLTWGRWSRPMCSVAPSSGVKIRSSRFGELTASS